MDNLSESDIEELKINAKKYFELEEALTPLNDELDEIKAKKRQKEYEIKNKSSELEIIRKQIIEFFEKHDIGTLDTNKGKFKVYTPQPKIHKYKSKEIKENLEKLFTEKFNTSVEETEELYKQTHQKEPVKQLPQLKVLKPKIKEKVFLF